MKVRSFPWAGMVMLLSALFFMAPRSSAQKPGQWVSVGPILIQAPFLPDLGVYAAVGRLTTIAIDPADPAIMYVASPGELGHEGCGIWKTTDSGRNWKQIGDDLPELAVAAITIDPKHVIFVATVDNGVFRSDDSGETWTNLSAPLKVRTNTRDGNRTWLLIDPANPKVLYLTADDGVLRSEDGGKTWPVSLGAGQATSLVMDPRDPKILYAGILGSGVYKTVDGGVLGGASWKLQSRSPLPSSIPSFIGPLLALSHPAPDPHETVYALYPTLASGGTGWSLFRTTSGASWGSGPVYTCGPPSYGCQFFQSLAADPEDKQRVYMGGPLLYISGNGGVSFTQVPAVNNDRLPNSGHGDYRRLAFDPNDRNHVYALSDGGIYVSDKQGKIGSWSMIGGGITNAEIYDLAQAATVPGLFIAGTQDNGNIQYASFPMWNHIPVSQIEGGDGADVAIDPSKEPTMYTMGQTQDTLVQSTDGGNTFNFFSQGLPSSATNCAVYNSTFHFQTHPSKPKTLLASCNSLYETTTNVAPGNWKVIFSPPRGERVVRSAIDADSDTYFAGTDKGDLFAVLGSPPHRSERILSHPDSQNVTDIRVDPAHPDTIYVTFAPPFQVDRPCPSTTGQNRIFQLTRKLPDRPPAFTSENISGNLEHSPLCVNSIAIDPYLPRTLYAGTNRGVYLGRRKASGGAWVWQAYKQGMPLADVRDLEVHPSSHKIDAATYGRGAFELIPKDFLSVRIEIERPVLQNTGKLGPAVSVFPVAILSTEFFDTPGEVDDKSLRFGRTGKEASPRKCEVTTQDIGGKSVSELVCYFEAKLTGLPLTRPPETTTMVKGILKGLTKEGTPIEGQGSVTIPK